MHEDGFRDVQLHRSKIPDGQNARLDHLIRHRLRDFGRGGDDAQMNTHPRAKNGHFFQGQDSLPVDPLANFVWIGIKSSHDPQAELRESFMAEQRCSQVSSSHQKRFGHVVPAEKCFNGQNEFGNRVARLRLANDACILKILADLYGDAIQISADDATGDLADPLRFKIHQIMVVLGKPLQTSLRNGERQHSLRR